MSVNICPTYIDLEYLYDILLHVVNCYLKGFPMTATVTITVTPVCDNLTLTPTYEGIEREFDSVDVHNAEFNTYWQRYEVAYFEFEAEHLSLDAIPALMKSQGNPHRPWVPANTRQLLAFAKRFPETQLEKNIVALNAVTMEDGKGYRRCLCLTGYGGKRALEDGGTGNLKVSAFRFLAVR